MNRFMRNLNGFLAGFTLIVVLVLLTGCSTAKPYGEFSLGYQIDKNTDWALRTDQDWQCSDNLQFNGAVGLEFPNEWTISYNHQSWVLCGSPLNDKSELYQDDIRVTKKFGGIK